MAKVRITARLTRGEIELLDRLAARARSEGGTALSRSAVLRALLHAAYELGPALSLVPPDSGSAALDSRACSRPTPDPLGVRQAPPR